MGANFLWALAPIWKSTDERQAKLKQVIAELSDEGIAQYEEEYHIFNTEVPNEARERILEACMACETDQCYTRETTDMKLTEMPWRAVVTGGLSWGDSPTDVFDSFVIVGTVEEVYNLLKEWSTEDEV